MIITDKAKEIILEIMTSNSCQAVILGTQSAGCSKSLSFDLAPTLDGKEPVYINEVPVLIDEETMAWTADVTIDGDNGQLMLLNPNSGCAGCSGCH